jgi:hypothetical protein
MKTIKVFSETYGTMVIKAETLDDAVKRFMRMHPKHKVSFAYDTMYPQIKKQFHGEAKA